MQSSTTFIRLSNPIPEVKNLHWSMIMKVLHTGKCGLFQTTMVSCSRFIWITNSQFETWLEVDVSQSFSAFCHFLKIALGTRLQCYIKLFLKFVLQLIYLLTLFNVKENTVNVIANQNEPKSAASENHLSIRDL